MTAPLRVLHVLMTLDRGGIESMLIHHLRAIDRSRVQFDFLIHRAETGAYEAEVCALGARVYRVCALRTPWDMVRWIFQLRRFFREHPYDVVQIHLEQEGRIVSQICARAGILMRICHSHNTASQRRGLKRWGSSLFARFFPWNATDFFACSRAAGRWLFGAGIVDDSRFQIFENAIDTAHFLPDLNRRNAMRKALNLSAHQVVIGHVGRFNAQKNHAFLIRVFAAYAERHAESVLLLVGEGPDRPGAERQVESLGLSGRVIFCGGTDDVAPYYDAMDCFCFPSRFEGLGIVLLEAQQSGLPCVCSDCIEPEACFSDSVVQLSLDAPVETWCAAIEQAVARPRPQHGVLPENWDLAHHAAAIAALYENGVARERSRL